MFILCNWDSMKWSVMVINIQYRTVPVFIDIKLFPGTSQEFSKRRSRIFVRIKGPKKFRTRCPKNLLSSFWQEASVELPKTCTVYIRTYILS